MLPTLGRVEVLELLPPSLLKVRTKTGASRESRLASLPNVSKSVLFVQSDKPYRVFCTILDKHRAPVPLDNLDRFWTTPCT